MGQAIGGQRRWIAIVVATMLALGGLFAAAGGDAYAASPKTLKKKAIKKTKGAVKNELTEGTAAGLAEPASPPKIKVSSCKTKKTKFECSWSAKGEAAGRVPIHCSGTAIIDARAKKVKRLDPCNNTQEVQAPLLASPHPVGFGYFEDWATSPLFGKLKAGGAQLARVGLSWKALQPSPPTPSENPQTAWSWAGFDSIAAALKAVGVRPIWTFTDSPCWATPSCGGESNAPNAANIPDYAKAAAEIAKRYPRVGGDRGLAGAERGQVLGRHPGSAEVLVDGRPDGRRGRGDRHRDPGDLRRPRSGCRVPGQARLRRVHPPGGRRGRHPEGGGESASTPSTRCRSRPATTRRPATSAGSDPGRGDPGRARDAAARRSRSRSTQLSYSTLDYTEAQQAEALTSSLALASKLAGVPTVIVSRLLDNGDGSKVSGFGVLNPNGTARSRPTASSRSQVGAGIAC